jgi:hypothetical protein
MKNYKAIMPILAIIIVAFGIYYCVNTSFTSADTYNQKLADARYYAEKGIPSQTIPAYEAVLGLRMTQDVSKEYMQYLLSHQGTDAYLNYLSNTYLKNFPKDSEAYVIKAKAAIKYRDYSGFYSTYNLAYSKYAPSDELKELYSNLEWQTIDESDWYPDNGFLPYNSSNVAITASTDPTKEDVSYDSNGKKINTVKWGTVFKDSKGGIIRSTKFEKMGPFFNHISPVIGDFKPNQGSDINVIIDSVGSQSDDPDNKITKAYFVDSTNATSLIADAVYQEFGTFSEDVFPAKDSSDKWLFLNSDFERIGDPNVTYDVATGFYNGVAAVGTYSDSAGKKYDTFFDLVSQKTHENVLWKVIDNSGKQVGDQSFDDIKINSAGLIAGSGAFFGKPTGSDVWYLYSTDGTQIKNDAEKGFSDADAFNSMDKGDVTYAAVKKIGENPGDDLKWGYVDAKGNLKIDYKFTNARSFLNSTAPASGEVVLDDADLTVNNVENNNSGDSPSNVQNDSDTSNSNESTDASNQASDDSDEHNDEDRKNNDSDNDSNDQNTFSRWGYINIDGDFVIKPLYVDATSFSAVGYAIVNDGKQWHSIGLVKKIYGEDSKGLFG